MFRLGLDIDGTISAAPERFAALAKAVMDGGGKVYIVHGAGKTPNDEAVSQAKERLSALGFDGLYDVLYCAPKPTAKNKAAYCVAQGIDLLIDNRAKNCRAVAKAGVPAARFIP